MTQLDLGIERFSSIVMVRPFTDAGIDWLRENTGSEPWQWLGGALAVEPRYVDAIMEGADADGLLVGEGEA